MSRSHLAGFRIAGVASCTPSRSVSNSDPSLGFDPTAVRKVVAMAGVRERRVSRPGTTSADLCTPAAKALLERLGWEPSSVTGLIFVTQTPDYFLPSTACVVQERLGLPDSCAAFDVGLGCSGYPYGLYLAACMLKGGGHQRVLMLHGETPTHFLWPQDHATTLLFSDAGSATALEVDARPDREGHFCLHTDGAGRNELIVRGGAYRDRDPVDPRHRFLEMDGAATFNFTLARVPPLIEEALAHAGLGVNDIDSYVFHQSNRFMMKHLMKKCGLPEDRVPMTIDDMGNTGGPSVAVTLARRVSPPAPGQLARLLLLGYGVGLSWGSAIVPIDDDIVLLHLDLDDA